MATQSRLGSVSESFDDRRGPERRNEDCSGRGLPKGKEASGPRQKTPNARYLTRIRRDWCSVAEGRGHESFVWQGTRREGFSCDLFDERRPPIVGCGAPAGDAPIAAPDEKITSNVYFA